MKRCQRGLRLTAVPAVTVRGFGGMAGGCSFGTVLAALLTGRTTSVPLSAPTGQVRLLHALW